MNLVGSKRFSWAGKGKSYFFKKKKCLASNLQNPLDFENLAQKTCKTNVLREDLQLDYLGEGSSTELSTASKRKIDRPAGFEEGVAVSLFCLVAKKKFLVTHFFPSHPGTGDCQIERMVFHTRLIRKKPCSFHLW